MPIERIDNHKERARNRLISQYSGMEKIEGLIDSYVCEIQELEDATIDALNNTSIFTAQGTNLDTIGDIVGAARLTGESDDLYRPRIFATIVLNSSEGTPENVITAFNLLRGTDFVLYKEFFPGEVSLSSTSEFVDKQDVITTFETIDSILPAGVRLNFISTFDETTPFAFAGNLQGEGFGSINNSTEGGFFSTIEQRCSFFAFGSINETLIIEGGNEGFGSLKDPLVGGLFTTL